MKKVFGLVLALALALSLSVASFAALEDVTLAIDDASEIGADAQELWETFIDTVGVDKAKEAVSEALGELDIPADVNAGDLAEGTDADVAAAIISKLGLEGTDLANTIEGAMSNDFVAFLAAMYVPVVVPVTKPAVTTEKETTQPPKGVDPVIKTGDSSVIAIATFAALSAAAAAAFVCMKKKED